MREGRELEIRLGQTEATWTLAREQQAAQEENERAAQRASGRDFARTRQAQWSRSVRAGNITERAGLAKRSGSAVEESNNVCKAGRPGALPSSVLPKCR